MTNMLDTISGIIAAKQLELEAKGYTHDQASAAIKRSRQWALRMAGMLRPELQEAGFVDFFNKNIEGAEEWIKSYKQAVQA